MNNMLEANNEQSNVLLAFSRALGREAHLLVHRPDLLWQQLYNRLQWGEEKVKRAISSQHADRATIGKKGWMRLRTPAHESEALINTRNVSVCAISPDGCWFATHEQHAIKIWDIMTGEEKATLRVYDKKINTCVFSTDGSSVIAGTISSSVEMWDIATEDEKLTLMHPVPKNLDWQISRAITTCAICSDGRWIVSASRGSKYMIIWDVMTGNACTTLESGMYGVDECAISLDGQWIVSISSDGSHGAIWDLASATERFSFSEHPTCCAISPDGHWLVLGHANGNLAIRDIANGTDLITTKPEERVKTTRNLQRALGKAKKALSVLEGQEASFSVLRPPDFLLAQKDSQCREVAELESALEPSELNELITWKAHTKKVTKCAISSDGLFIISVSEDKTIGIWDSRTGEHLNTLIGHTQDINHCAFSPSGNLIILASKDGTLKIWDAIQHIKGIKTVSHTGDVTTCAFSPDGTFSVSASEDQTLKIWDTVSSDEKTNLYGHVGKVTCFSISPDGHYIVSGGDDYHGGRTILWNVNSGQKITELKTDTRSEIRACSFSPKGDWNVSLTNRFIVWDMVTKKEKYRLKGHDVTGGPFNLLSPGRGNYWTLTVGKKEIPLYWWELDDQKWKQSQTLMNYAFTISPDGRWIITAGAQHNLKSRFGNLRIWNAANGMLKAELIGYQGVVESCAINPDGRSIISAKGGAIKIWNIENGKVRMTIETDDKYGSTTIHISPDGGFFLAYSKVWDMNTGNEIFTIGRKTGLSISSDGQWIVALSDNMVQLLEGATREIRAEFPLNDYGTALALHPVYPIVVCGEKGGALHLFDLVGISYGPLIVTAIEIEHRLMVRCPACQRDHKVSSEKLGSEITCPQAGCGKRLKLNSFDLKSA